MVKCIVLTVCLLSFYTYSGMAQTNIASAARLIATADSVILISHLTTEEHHDKPLGIVAPPGVGAAPEPIVFSSFFAATDINPGIIVQRQRLGKPEIIALAKIIRKPIKRSRSRIGYAPLCFEPHHAILMYHKAVFSYIDICFHCHDLVTSSDMELSNMDFDEKWAELKAFFLQLQLTYEMEDGR